MRKVRQCRWSSFGVIVALLAVACDHFPATEYLGIYHETTTAHEPVSPAKITFDANGTDFVSQPGLNRISVYGV